MPSLYVEENNQIIDIQLLEQQGYTDIHFQGFHLTGGIESSLPYNECFFGSVDSKDTQMGLDETKPIYQLMSEYGYDTKDSKETSTLQVFLNDNSLTLLNYSILDSSLNIKLECKSKESKAIQEKEKAQREQKEQDSKNTRF